MEVGIIMENISYSQCGEDIIISFLMESVLGIKKITYLDIGSNHPKDFNNSYFFYKKGITGVSMDANPYFKKLYKEIRPNDKFICAGVGPNDTKSKFYILDPHTLSTFSKNEAENYTKNGTHKLIEAVNVKILSIETILKKYFKKDLPNLLSLDVEGYDFEIINSINFEKWRPAVICAETLTYTTDSSEGKITKIIDLILKNDYRIYADTYINTVFVDNKVWVNR